MTSVAVFFRGKSRKNSSMYWISSAPCWSPYCFRKYSTAENDHYSRLWALGFKPKSLFRAQSHDGIDARRAPRGQIARDEGDRGQHDRHQREGGGIGRLHAEEHLRQRLRHERGHHEPGG